MSTTNKQYTNPRQSLIINNFIKITLSKNMFQKKLCSNHKDSKKNNILHMRSSASNNKQKQKLSDKLHSSSVFSHNFQDDNHTSYQSLRLSYKQPCFGKLALLKVGKQNKSRIKTQIQYEQEKCIKTASKLIKFRNLPQNIQNSLGKKFTFQSLKHKNNLCNKKSETGRKYFINDQKKRKMHTIKYIKAQQTKFDNKMNDMQPINLTPVLNSAKIYHKTVQKTLNKLITKDIKVKNVSIKQKKSAYPNQSEEFSPWTPRKNQFEF